MREIWNAHQRRVLAILVILGAAALSVRRWRNSVYIPADRNAAGARLGEIHSKLDPNLADWKQLAVLPGLGEKKARAITEFRVQYGIDHPGETAFKSRRDLLKVNGIGVGIAETIEPYLDFPPATTTREK